MARPGFEDIQRLLEQIYGPDKGRAAFARLAPLVEGLSPAPADVGADFFSQQDVYLITYGDTLQKAGQAPLATLYDFVACELSDVISGIHFLPFFPYSSDDGFSVMDFTAINPQLGDWPDVVRFSEKFDLMFDFVINHFSAQSRWFADYLADRPGYAEFAIEVDPAADLSQVTRPRSLPLLTAFEKHDGRRVHLWTTFSADQIDFNYRSLDVLEKMIRVMLLYVQKGAAALRLDAIAYLWKEIGTSCIHLPQTHAMVKLFRRILDLAAPRVMIVTETNVPHAENISYFGNGHDEAQMVYNFTLPPLLLHTFAKQDATVLSAWARGLELPSAANTFFNFTASHDGIGVRPLEGILPPAAVDDLVAAARANGGRVSYKQNPDGSQSPYELNITYVDAILADRRSQRSEKFLASQAVQYALPGVPATYIHSLLGSRNWEAGVAQTGRARSINREKPDAGRVLAELRDPQTLRSKIFNGYVDLIRLRRRQPAFHPNAAFEILDLGPRLFAVKRSCAQQTLYALTNISDRRLTAALPAPPPGGRLYDLATGRAVDAAALELEPYQYLWLSAEAG